MPSKPTVRESDRGLRYLEDKLSLVTGTPGTRRRNPALDILTGKTPDTRTQAAAPQDAPAAEPVSKASAEPASAPQPVAAAATQPKKSHPVTVVLPRPTAPRVAPSYRPMSSTASPWLAPVAPAPKQERIRMVAPPMPRPSVLSVWLPRAAALALTGAVALGVGIAARSVLQSSSTPTEVIVVASPQPAQAQPTLAPAVAPTIAATAVPTIAPTQVPPTAVPTQAAPVLADQFKLLLDERFSDPKLAWPKDASRTAWVGDGMLRIEPRDAGKFVALGVPTVTDQGDVVLSGTFKKLDGPAGGGYGFIVRDESPTQRDGTRQDGRFYVFEIGDRGELGIWLRDGETWVDLLPWTQSDVVNAGQATNELSVSAIGDHLTFMVNGILVASQHDTVLHRGGIGIFVGGDGNSVGVERLAVRVPR